MYDQVGADGKAKFTAAQIAAEFGISRPTDYRYLDQAPDTTGDRWTSALPAPS